MSNLKFSNDDGKIRTLLSIMHPNLRLEPDAEALIKKLVQRAYEVITFSVYTNQTPEITDQLLLEVLAEKLPKNLSRSASVEGTSAVMRLAIGLDTFEIPVDAPTISEEMEVEEISTERWQKRKRQTSSKKTSKKTKTSKTRSIQRTNTNFEMESSGTNKRKINSEESSEKASKKLAGSKSNVISQKRKRESRNPMTQSKTPKKETTPRKTAKKETTLRKTAKKESTQRKTAKKETTPRKTAKKETIPRETAKKETTPRKTAKIATTPRKRAKKETTPRKSRAREEITPRKTKRTAPKSSTKMPIAKRIRKVAVSGKTRSKQLDDQKSTKKSLRKVKDKTKVDTIKSVRKKREKRPLTPRKSPKRKEAVKKAKPTKRLETLESDKSVSEESVSDESVSDESVSDESVSDESLSDDILSDESVFDDRISSRRTLNTLNFVPGIKKLLTIVHNRLKLSNDAEELIDLMLRDAFEKIRSKTESVDEVGCDVIESALESEFPPFIVQQAKSESHKDLLMFESTRIGIEPKISEGRSTIQKREIRTSKTHKECRSSSKKQTINFESSIEKILSLIHKNARISGDALAVVNDFLGVVCAELVDQMTSFARESSLESISPVEVRRAITDLLPRVLARHAMAEGNKSVMPDS